MSFVPVLFGYQTPTCEFIILKLLPVHVRITLSVLCPMKTLLSSLALTLSVSSLSPSTVAR